MGGPMKLPEVGELFDGRYQLDAILGAGGMGCVYRATEVTASRPVAVKIVRPVQGGYTSDTTARFQREVEIIANLSSQYTVTMLTAGEDPEGRLYMVFELVPGEDLADIISRAGRLDAPTTTHILRQVLSALREAHDAGLLHRDVKPDNIRVHERHGNEIHVKLLDFGIARRADGSQTLTQTGELVGTPRYMSPEQLTDRPLTPASDIYSLGIVAFEMLMGASSLQGRGWTDQVDRLLTGHVFSIPEIERVGPLASIISKMCARDPDDRYPSAAAVLAALDQADTPGERALPTMRVDTPPARALTTRDRLAQIPRWWWAVLALVVAGLGIGLYKVSGTVEPEQPKSHETVNTSALLKPQAAVAVANPVDAGSDVAPDLIARDFGRVTGCGETPPFTGTGELTDEPLPGINVASWVVHVPKGYDSSSEHPLIVLFHQDAQTPMDILQETRLRDLADEHGIVLLVPAWGRRPPAWVGDRYVDQVQRGVEAVRSSLCIDDAAVFAIGHGPGGRAAAIMPCVLDKVAAVAVSSYGIMRGTELCPAFENTPTINLYPLEDRNIPPEGGKGCALIDKIPLVDHEAAFRERNHCEGKRSVRFRHKGSTCYEWDCEAPFVSCHIDGGRGWPDAGVRAFDLLRCDGEPADFPYARTIWKFFTTATKR